MASKVPTTPPPSFPSLPGQGPPAYVGPRTCYIIREGENNTGIVESWMGTKDFPIKAPRRAYHFDHALFFGGTQIGLDLPPGITNIGLVQQANPGGSIDAIGFWKSSDPVRVGLGKIWNTKSANATEPEFLQETPGTITFDDASFLEWYIANVTKNEKIGIFFPYEPMLINRHEIKADGTPTETMKSSVLIPAGFLPVDPGWQGPGEAMDPLLPDLENVYASDPFSQFSFEGPAIFHKETIILTTNRQVAQIGGVAQPWWAGINKIDFKGSVFQRIKDKLDPLSAHPDTLTNPYFQDNVFSFPVPKLGSLDKSSPPSVFGPPQTPAGDHVPATIQIQSKYNYFIDYYESEISLDHVTESIMPSVLAALMESNNSATDLPSLLGPAFLFPLSEQGQSDWTNQDNKHAPPKGVGSDLEWPGDPRNLITLNGKIPDTFLDILAPWKPFAGYKTGTAGLPGDSVQGHPNVAWKSGEFERGQYFKKWVDVIRSNTGIKNEDIFNINNQWNTQIFHPDWYSGGHTGFWADVYDKRDMFPMYNHLSIQTDWKDTVNIPTVPSDYSFAENLSNQFLVEFLEKHHMLYSLMKSVAGLTDSGLDAEFVGAPPPAFVPGAFAPIGPIGPITVEPVGPIDLSGAKDIGWFGPPPDKETDIFTPQFVDETDPNPYVKVPKPEVETRRLIEVKMLPTFDPDYTPAYFPTAPGPIGPGGFGAGLPVGGPKIHLPSLANPFQTWIPWFGSEYKLLSGEVLAEIVAKMPLAKRASGGFTPAGEIIPPTPAYDINVDGIPDLHSLSIQLSKIDWAGNGIFPEALRFGEAVKLIGRLNNSGAPINEAFEEHLRRKTRTFKEIICGDQACTEIVFWRIQKWSAPSGAIDDTAKRIQDFYIPNGPGTPIIDFIDTQVKYGKNYIYRIYAWTAVYGTEYRYTFPNVFNTYEPMGAMGNLPGWVTVWADSNGAPCTPHISPFTGQPMEHPEVDCSKTTMTLEEAMAGGYDLAVGPQGPPIEGAPTIVTTLEHPFTFAGQGYDSESGTWATPPFDITGPQCGRNFFGEPITLGNYIGDVAYMMALDVETRPNLKIIEVPYMEFDPVFRVEDRPPLAPTAEPVPYKGVNNIFLLNLFSATGHRMEVPIPLLAEDQFLILNQYIAQNLLEQYAAQPGLYPTTPMEYKSDDPPAFFEVFRLDSQPDATNMFEVYQAFQKPNKYLKIPTEGTTAVSLKEEVEPNRKYYYTFRARDVHGNISNPTPIYEIELVDNDGAIYMVTNLYEPEEEPANPNKTVRRFLHIMPTIEQSQVNFEASGLAGVGLIKNSPTAAGFGEKIVLGVKPPGSAAKIAWTDSSSVFDTKKQFKVRLTSKNSGKMLDLNLNFKHTRNITQEEQNSELLDSGVIGQTIDFDFAVTTAIDSAILEGLLF